ncbi:hypothetical protein PHSY_001734 [Pseudozyma hubeiensis SY62]|uniref:Uncharacterized protein n=1 Tax=Pseudozyma hubeiensis (strain SY62) TaxID=1305764 RepID=R9NZ86_PSEHS|nr:hypothetical protein PHSY_001734 [Pseudozyma hubeiensis SY62]GAC94163.1 hypothetical protein PHSY_001734 [Pseudozyma hubeiensis SY62]
MLVPVEREVRASSRLAVLRQVGVGLLYWRRCFAKAWRFIVRTHRPDCLPEICQEFASPLSDISFAPLKHGQSVTLVVVNI